LQFPKGAGRHVVALVRLEAQAWQYYKSREPLSQADACGWGCGGERALLPAANANAGRLAQPSFFLIRTGHSGPGA
jgi:hypothetical protein